MYDDNSGKIIGKDKEKKRLDSYNKHISEISERIDKFFEKAELETVPFDDSSNNEIRLIDKSKESICNHGDSCTSNAICTKSQLPAIKTTFNTQSSTKRNFIFIERECQNPECGSTRDLVLCQNLSTEGIILCKDCMTTLSRNITTYLNL